MEKQKRWQYYLIVAVIFLTIYNILPTVFYYTKPLKSPIEEKKAQSIAASIVKRVNDLEPEAEDWIGSYCNLIKVKPLSIKLNPAQPQFITVNFKNNEDANLFRQMLPRAGSLIPFVPAQLSLYNPNDQTTKSVTVQRRIPVHFDESNLAQYYQYSAKFDLNGSPTPLYRALVNDRTLQIGMSLGGTSENALNVQGIVNNPKQGQTDDLTVFLAQNILSFTKVYGETSEAAKRYFASFSQLENVNRSQLIQDFSNKIDQLAQQIKNEKSGLLEESDKLKSQGGFLETVKQQRLDLLTAREKTLLSASAILKRNLKTFSSGLEPWNFATLAAALQASEQAPSQVQLLSLNGCNPYIESISIDWTNEKINLILYPDLSSFKQRAAQDSSSAYLNDLADQLLYNEIAFTSRQTGEEISPTMGKFSVNLNQLTNSKSFIAWKLSSIAQAQAEQLKDTLTSTWKPKHPDLSHENLPIYDYETYISLPSDQQKLALVIYSPALYKKIPPHGFHMNSIYVIAKGMDKIINRLQADGASAQAQQFVEEFNQLRSLLQQNGFVGYSGGSFALSPEFSHDFVFEAEDYFQTVLKATREDFAVNGTKRYAVLEFTDVEQRILTENKIDNHIHEDLLKWRDDYYAAQLGIKGISKFDVPKPTQNVYWDNFKLSFVKYFRGDDRKILHWGLDLSGGKTVQIELRDTNNRVVTNEADIKQGINELYNRVNKMGVSEVSIRQEGNYITLDFPGSQGLSAAELVKASTMYFNIVNEKFTSNNPALADATNRFLQDVWNEAVVTNRKSAEELNLIAWKHIYGDSMDPDVIQPRTEAARILYNNGLRLPNPQDAVYSSIFSENYSKIAIFRGNDFTDWQGQTHPLVIVFQNYALEGSNLDQVHASYDPSKGNFLSFSIKSSYTGKDGQKVQPRDDLFAWTSQFAKEKITGTPLEAYSSGRGWRMAVILNGTIISAPTLDSALKDSAMITGSFTQREVNQLEADLKAGSLSFTPHILSEKNVSPELGSKERTRGIVSTLLSLALVIAVMVGYYKFGGLVASVAVLFNLLIMWATLQNLEATMTLAGIAGIILTVGMAVDANVLVFERVREEFAVSGRIASAVHAGYRKAFSAILDSNVTTIIAAMVLLHFDSGPIKGFAVTLIIGIISSMFTALFMTRFFFAGWVQNPKNKSLNMLNWFQSKGYDFLKYTKPTLLLSSIIILVGSFMLVNERHTMFGMDFSGGYALNVEVQPQSHGNYRQSIEEALLKQGATQQDIQIRELTPSNNIRIFLSRSLQQPGHPFYGMPLELETKDVGFSYETNPKIVWTVQALSKSGIELTPQSLASLDKNWTEVSGQMSDTMRNNAIIGLTIALLCILVYITIRFEFKYAISATLCLAHDVIFTVGVMALLHALGLPIQIDLNTVAALMTMVGYSLNDTIIVFDRIREDVRLMRKSSFSEIINHALNVTLSRTMLTSGSTLLVLIPLIFLGGSTLFGFALVMAIGVIFGTLSSLYIAAPLMKFFHDREEKKNAKILVSDPRS
ncbi:MAG: protein translocase subunit SecD [Parachlamydiales bacterium]|nr:protein translocase subunit SecD [Verrucomicrobiota bacterium]MBX3718487.1 protein translocase subunit SecD [Candidatus Acheromyda pituitae]